jgi:hypothetical protein
MKVCILCEDSVVSEVRKTASFILSTDLIHMNIPVSPTGEMPPTHWICFSNITTETYKNMIDNQKYSIIEESSPKTFLNKYNLKKINAR